MLQQLRHICFDKDGTITDVHVYWSDIINKRAYKLLAYYGLDPGYRKSLALAMGIDLNQKKIIPQGPVGYKPRNFVIAAASRALKALGVTAKTEEIKDVFLSVDQEMQEKDNYRLKLLKNIPKAFEELRNEGLKISVYTSDRAQNARHIMKKLNLERYVDIIVGGDDVQKSKPDSEGFKKACDGVGVPLAHSVYVGDTLEDLRMANSCESLGGVGITTGLCSKEQLLRQSKFVFDNLEDFSKCLSKYFRKL